MLAYWRRHCPAALAAGRAGWETLARTHNGGPRGMTKSATADYWRRVQRALTASSETHVAPAGATPWMAIDVTEHRTREPFERVVPGAAAVAAAVLTCPDQATGWAIDGGRDVVPPFSDRAGRPAPSGRPRPGVCPREAEP